MSELVGGLVVGLAASIAFAFATWCIDRLRMWKAFSRYAGTYTQIRKFPLEGSPDSETLTIAVKRNVLAVRFEEGAGHKRSVHGEIVMNKQLPNRGEGHYDHVEDTQQLWGFWNVQIKNDDTILVHTTYASTADTLVLQGYIWTRAMP